MTNGTSSDTATRRFDFQKELLEKGFEQVQKQVMHLDDILFRIKASAITVWVALMGWAFTSNNPLIIPLGLVAIIGFWLLEAMFKGAQIGYIRTSLKLMQVVNDTGSLQKQFEKQQFEGGIVYPLALKPTEIERLALMGKGFSGIRFVRLPYA